MGSLTLPSSGPVYADAQIFIYSVEKHPIYAPLLRPLWESVARGDLEVVSSELTLMETLVGPLKTGDTALKVDYENLFICPGIRLLPITPSILREGARLRATLSSLRTPDALHAATASSCSCTLVLTDGRIEFSALRILAGRS
jgi:predicted nucleic acid-binding protein